MYTIVIVLLILLGLFLLILELFVLPGVTFAGLGGALFIGVGIFMAYSQFGQAGGNAVLIATVSLSVLVIVWSLRSGTWNKLMLNSSVDSKVEVKEDNDIKVGDEGIAISRLNPVGKAIINNIIVEARCPGQFIDEDTPLEVQKVFKTYIIVKPKI
ncbi:NfeD-like C-terminal, partner-binding [Saccharicrinis carchari]|uniref:NfeD-like C-terminal, partner-binding n=1 Tax=Saccharicrinis carchari TaxID=1168039 RepID=A0A521D4Z7_SACCC|nr:NfeD family protein [Saccharicrinis carchari]SMO66749.1 NfeD-like C-terminal, partner-binding [Saccharicrinis carchari]